MKNTLSRAFALWLPILVATSALFLASYWGIQQQYRLSLNDPQIQMAEDAAARLAGGEVPAALISREAPPVDIAGSLAPWLAVYDSSGMPLESSAVLDNAPPHLPQGVFSEATWKKQYAEWGIKLDTPAHEDRFTWQPRPGVREAVVLVHIKTDSTEYFVAAGRNMHETESRVQTFTAGYALAWGAAELGALIALFIVIALGWL